MRKIKKLIALAACVVMSASIFTGCGGSTSASKDGEIVTLKWYTIGGEPKDLGLVEDEINKYLVEKINAKVDMQFIGYGDYSQKMSVIINSGESFDMAFTSSWAADYLTNARKGGFLELDEYLETVGKDMKETIDSRFWDGATIDGKIYGVPNQKEIATSKMWVFTKEYVDKYNIPYTELHSLQDLEPWLKIIKENEPDVVPFYISKGFSGPQYFDQLVDPLGVEFGDETLTIKNMYETDQMKKDLETLRKYFKLGYINSDSATTQDERSRKRFVTKGDGQPYAETLWSKDLKYDVVASPIMDSYITNASTTGSMIAVSSNSKNKEKSVEFLNLLNTDSYLRNLINFGIEGTHYNKTDDGKVEIIEGRGLDYEVGYYTLGNLFITDVLSNEPLTKWDEFREFNDAAKNSPALGFKFDTSPVSNEIAAINNVLAEYGAVLYSGAVDTDEYLTKLKNKLKEQGIDKVQVEMQKQIDEWKKTQ